MEFFHPQLLMHGNVCRSLLYFVLFCFVLRQRLSCSKAELKLPTEQKITLNHRLRLASAGIAVMSLHDGPDMTALSDGLAPRSVSQLNPLLPEVTYSVFSVQQRGY